MKNWIATALLIVLLVPGFVQAQTTEIDNGSNATCLIATGTLNGTTLFNQCTDRAIRVNWCLQGGDQFTVTRCATGTSNVRGPWASAGSIKLEPRESSGPVVPLRNSISSAEVARYAICSGDDNWQLEGFSNFTWRCTRTTLGGTGSGSNPSGSTATIFAGSVGISSRGTAQVELRADRIEHRCPVGATGQSGTLRLRLFALTSPYPQSTSGFELASYSINPLNCNTSRSGILSGAVAYTKPPAGTYSLVMFLEKLSNGNFVVADYVNFSGTLGVEQEQFSFGGEINIAVVSSVATIKVGKVRRTCAFGDTSTSGTVRLRLFAYAQPFNAVSPGPGFVLATRDLGTTMPCNTNLIGIDGGVPYVAPPQSAQFRVLLLEELRSTGWVTQSYIELPVSVSTVAPLVLSADNAGSYYDAARSGEGVQISFLMSNGRRTMFLALYTYDLIGNPLFLTGSAEVPATGGGPVNVPMFSTRGPAFGPGFNAAQLQIIPWGNVGLTFLDCSTIKLSYVSSVSGYGSGNLLMSRLVTSPGGCRLL